MTAHPSCQHHPVPEVQPPRGPVSAPYMHTCCLSRHSPMVLQSPSAPSLPAYLIRTQPPARQLRRHGDDNEQSQKAPHVYTDLTRTPQPTTYGSLLRSRFHRDGIDGPTNLNAARYIPFLVSSKTQARPSQDYHLGLPPQVWDATPPPPAARQRARPSDRSHFSSLPPFNGNGREHPHIVTLSLPATHRHRRSTLARQRPSLPASTQAGYYC